MKILCHSFGTQKNLNYSIKYQLIPPCTCSFGSCIALYLYSSLFICVKRRSLLISVFIFSSFFFLFCLPSLHTYLILMSPAPPSQYFFSSLRKSYLYSRLSSFNLPRFSMFVQGLKFHMKFQITFLSKTPHR